jgi:vacuolar-type H+-ATPase subunit H
MAATESMGMASADGLASLERLKQVETDGDGRLRMVRGKIDLTLSQLRAESEAQIEAAKKQADEEAEQLLAREEKEADAQAAQILDQAKTDLAQRARSGPADLTDLWPKILEVLFGEFR